MTKLKMAAQAAFGSAWNYPGWKWLIFWLAVFAFAVQGGVVAL